MSSLSTSSPVYRFQQREDFKIIVKASSTHPSTTEGKTLSHLFVIYHTLQGKTGDFVPIPMMVDDSGTGNMTVVNLRQRDVPSNTVREM